jgi:hypothetical protein
MKILRAIPVDRIPSRMGGGRSASTSTFYNQVAARLDKLSPNSALPIECESNEECVSVQHALTWRGYTYVTRQHIVYAKRKVN